MFAAEVGMQDKPFRPMLNTLLRNYESRLRFTKSEVKLYTRWVGGHSNRNFTFEEFTRELTAIEHRRKLNYDAKKHQYYVKKTAEKKENLPSRSRSARMADICRVSCIPASQDDAPSLRRASMRYQALH